MENKLIQCDVFTIDDNGDEGRCIFKGINIVLRQEITERRTNTELTERRTNTELDIIGQYTENVHTHDFRKVAFHTQYQRMNVIEILKRGQFFKYNGRGYVTTFTFPDTSDQMVTLTIQVKGEITQV